MAVIPNHRGAAQKCAVGNDLLEGSDLCKMWAMVLKKQKGWETLYYSISEFRSDKCNI